MYYKYGNLDKNKWWFCYQSDLYYRAYQYFQFIHPEILSISKAMISFDDKYLFRYSSWNLHREYNSFIQYIILTILLEGRNTFI